MKSLKAIAGLLILFGSLFAVQPASARGDVVQFRSAYGPGTIVVSTGTRQLFYVLDGGRAIRYPVGVGKAGMAWHGRAYVAAKHIRPAWARIPGRTPTYPGGSPQNPMGAAAMGLDRGNYAIHGTNDPSSIGGYVSHGCIRMHNADIMDLYRRTPIGTEVHVVQ
ncbi:L,D-transpeptidase [Undibacter mobilis]|uniref:L,D-transpeptidase n=1 Tax=Undibacter mobilis TaxID=2292256 RepID=A0A371B8Q6_9BRAD|nr:L,D-transpeptidase [Undibacter mobilis]RDV03985.1 L,D-transpeptidase [Undibacter mobilis]